MLQISERKKSVVIKLNLFSFLLEIKETKEQLKYFRNLVNVSSDEA
jgi:hypothetical protein